MHRSQWVKSLSDKLLGLWRLLAPFIYKLERAVSFQIEINSNLCTLHIRIVLHVWITKSCEYDAAHARI